MAGAFDPEQFLGLARPLDSALRVHAGLGSVWGNKTTGSVAVPCTASVRAWVGLLDLLREDGGTLALKSEAIAEHVTDVDATDSGHGLDAKVGLCGER